MKPPKFLLALLFFVVPLVVFIAMSGWVSATEVSSTLTPGEIAVINDQQIPLVGESGFYIFVGIIFVVLVGLLIFSLRKPAKEN